MKKNRYSRALKILKSTEVDDKIKSLNEMPTNHTTGLYALNDPGFRVGDKDPEEIFVPDVDGEWPDGVPGTPGEYRYVRPKGYWSGGRNWETVNTPDLSQDYLENDPTGRNTDGLISSDGVVKTFLPPDSRNFILGPVVDGFVPNHTYDAYTNIGYIQKDTRQFVLLARIQGQFKANLNGNYPVWDGTSNGLTIYNQNFTLEMAQWVRDQVNSDKFITNVPYFYSGGVPQRPQGPADCPNCPPGMYGGNGYGGGDGSGPFGWGSGGDTGNITIGNQQDAPRSGDAKDAGFPWEIFKNIANKVTDAAKNAWDFATKTADAISSMFDDPKAAIESGLYNLGQSFAQQFSGSGADFNSYARTIQDTINSFVNTYNPPPYNPDPRAVANMMTPEENAAFKAGGGAAALTKGNQSIQDVISQGYKNLGQYDSSIGRTTTSSTSNTELQRLMSKPPGTHTPVERQKLLDAGLDDFVRGGKTASPLGDLAILGATAALVKGAAAAGLSGLAKLGLAVSGTAIANQAKETFADKANSADQYNKQLAGKLVSSIISGQPQKIELSDNAKKDQIKNVNIPEFEKALQIRPTPKPSADSTVNPTQKRPVLTGGWGAQGGSEVYYDPKTDTLTIKSEKMLRTTSGGNTVERDSSGKITRFSDIPEPTDAQVSELTKKLMTGPLEPLMQGLSNVAQFVSTNDTPTWNKIKSDPFLLQVFSDNLGKAANDLAKGAVQGTASNTVALRKVLTNLGMPQSEIEKTGGGYGQVYSQTSYKGNEIPPELRKVIDKKTNFKETFYLKKVKSIIKEQEAVQPTTSPSVPSPSLTPEQPSARMGTGETPTPQSKAQLNFLLKQDSPGFISGYLGGMDVDDLKNSLVGTNLSWQTTNTIIKDIKNYDSLGRFYTQEWSRLTSYYTPIRNDLISKMQSAINAKDMGSFYRNLSEIDKTFSITDSYMKAADQATKSWSETIDRLYEYVKGGKLNPQSPFQLDDPTVARSQQEKRKRDEEIVKEIQKLNQEASDNEKAAQLNRLKALGMGALVAGVLVLGAAVLAKPAIVSSLGAATIRALKGLLGLSDDAIKGIRGSVDDIGQAGLGNVTGQVADDAASVVNKLLKGSGGEVGGRGRTIANQIQRAVDDGDVELVKKLIKSAEKYLYNSYEPKGKFLSESRRRILREIKKPVVVPEIPKQKYKMNFSGKYSPQNTPDKTSSELSDALVASGNARGQKWRMEDKYWQGYETTERMNVIYDQIGHGDQAWEMIVGENKIKKTWRDKEIQEHLNIIAHEKAMKEENPDYQSPFSELLDEQETIETDKEPLFKKVSKRLKKEIDYSDKPSKNGDPNEPPPEMVNGYHPNFGKRVDYYKKLDPQSASAMPATGDPEIDAEVKKARKNQK